MGGFEYPDIPNKETLILDVERETWEVISEGPNCGEPPPYSKTSCGVWRSDNIIVPTYDTNTELTCTAILNLKTKTWSKLEHDNRHQLTSGVIAELADSTQLAYIGGKSTDRKKYGKLQRTIYYLVDERKGWEFIPIDVIALSEAYIGSGCDTIVPFPNKDFNVTWHDVNKIYVDKLKAYQPKP